MKDDKEVIKILSAMFFQLACLIAGITFIGMGTNGYVAVGVLCLVLYSNTARDET